MFGNNPTSRIRDIETFLTASGVKPPKPLAVALDAYHATEYEPPLVDVALEAQTVNPDDVPDLIERAALASVVAAYATTPATKHEATRFTVQQALSGRVHREFIPVVPAVVAGLATRFDEHAAALTEQVPELPRQLDLKVASDSGATALAAWGRAAEHCQQLDTLAGLRTMLDDSYGTKARIASPIVEAATRWAEFDDEETAAEIGRVARVPQLSMWVGIIRTPGVTRLRWVTADEQLEAVARFAAVTEAAERRQAEAARAAGEAESAAIREGRIIPPEGRVRPIPA